MPLKKHVIIKSKRFVFNDHQILVEYKMIKNAYIRIKSDYIHLTVPRKTSENFIHTLLKQKLSWINEKVLLQSTNKNISMSPFSNEEELSYLGKKYRLLVNENTKENFVSINEENIILNVKDNANKQAVLDHWYRQQLSNLLPELIEKWQQLTGVSVKEWRIKRMKTRWGSCNIRARRIWLNQALIYLPLECIEHVVLHEMVHLLEAGHNKRFYGFMDEFMPQWRVYDQYMNSVNLL